MEMSVEKIVEALERLSMKIAMLTEATQALSTLRVTGKIITDDDYEKMAADFERIFNALYEIDPFSELTRGEILSHFYDSGDTEIEYLVDWYDLPNCRSKGYRAFIDFLRSKSRRERHVDGGKVLVGLKMKTFPVESTVSNKKGVPVGQS